MDSTSNTSITETPSVEEFRRLSLVRHLYGLGVAQSRGPDPTAALSILPFHDAAESFLQLACERYEAGENKADFMRYWELLAAKGVIAPQRETMRRLNAARRGLKHQGILPAHVELEGFRAAVTNFLYDSTLALFGVAFDQISLVSLIGDNAARVTLDEGYGALSTGNHPRALEAAACAFILVQRAKNERDIEPTPFGRKAFLKAQAGAGPSISFALQGLDRTPAAAAERSLRLIAERNDVAVEVFSEVIELIGHGVDFSSYSKFKLRVPIVHQVLDGSLHPHWGKEPTSDIDVVRECLDFVVHVALQFRV